MLNKLCRENTCLGGTMGQQRRKGKIVITSIPADSKSTPFINYFLIIMGNGILVPFSSLLHSLSCG